VNNGQITTANFDCATPGSIEGTVLIDSLSFAAGATVTISQGTTVILTLTSTRRRGCPPDHIR
jgi:hypothetical protein